MTLPMSQEIGILPSLSDMVDRVFSSLDVTPNTLTQYRRDLRSFLRFLEEEAWDANTILRYKKSLRNNVSLSVATKSKYLTVSKIFTRELYRQGLVERDVGRGVKGFSRSRSHSRTPISKKHLADLFKSSLTSKNKAIHTVLHLLYYNGLRRNEVRLLTVEDLDLKSGRGMIQGKSRDEKEEVFLHPRCVEELEKYLKEKKIRSGFLFPSPSDLQKPISQVTMWRWITREFKKVGITTNPHGLRKSFVSGLIEGGMDLVTVSQFSRHRDLSQLQTYYDRVSVKKAFPKFVESLELVTAPEMGQDQRGTV